MRELRWSATRSNKLDHLLVVELPFLGYVGSSQMECLRFMAKKLMSEV